MHRRKAFLLGSILHCSCMLSRVATSESDIRICPVNLEDVSVLCFVTYWRMIVLNLT